MRPSPPTLTGKKTSGETEFCWHYLASLPNIYSPHTSLNSTIVDLRLNENKIRSVHYSSLSRFGNLTYLNLTKNDISYVEDGAFSAQFNLQVSCGTMYAQHICTLMDALFNAHTYNEEVHLPFKCFTLHYISGGNISLFTPIHLFRFISYFIRFSYRLNHPTAC